MYTVLTVNLMFWDVGDGHLIPTVPCYGMFATGRLGHPGQSLGRMIWESCESYDEAYLLLGSFVGFDLPICR